LGQQAQGLMQLKLQEHIHLLQPQNDPWFEVSTIRVFKQNEQYRALTVVEQVPSGGKQRGFACWWKPEACASLGNNL
jgi:hypothetical protein